ncbi:hypothetical protein NE236_39655 [Actinoallomurus purpureus]|uniref:hypothetical protein n=1 Tax=Actinoallomurus purpureus TaxID=478114 RepID=UPI0020929ADC|nr:hypothetical protein [Actinoallomurus purpureus]MCO6011090.1 hypothetical protein [Actinoallomurus purpureus]
MAAAAGLGGYFVAVGLDKADKLASAVSALIGLAGLVVSVYGVILARQATAPASPAPPPPGGQSVTGSTIGGGVTQVRSVGSDLHLGAPPPGLARPPAVPPKPEAGKGVPGEQAVRDARVAGEVTQIDGVGGDADIDR